MKAMRAMVPHRIIRIACIVKIVLPEVYFDFGYNPVVFIVFIAFCLNTLLGLGKQSNNGKNVLVLDMRNKKNSKNGYTMPSELHGKHQGMAEGPPRKSCQAKAGMHRRVQQCNEWSGQIGPKHCVQICQKVIYQKCSTIMDEPSAFEICCW